MSFSVGRDSEMHKNTTSLDHYYSNPRITSSDWHKATSAVLYITDVSIGFGRHNFINMTVHEWERDGSNLLT